MTTSPNHDGSGGHLERLLLRFTPNNLTYTILGLSILIIATRIVSGRRAALSTISTDDNGSKPIPGVPYWLPILGHLPNMAINPTGFLTSLRDCYTAGAFALNFGGSVHNVVFAPGLATALLNQKTETADSENVSMHMMVYAFGCPPSEIKLIQEPFSELVALYRYLLSEPSLGQIVKETAQRAQQNVLQLVSGLASPVDQAQWERTADSRIRKVPSVDGSEEEEVVEASLLPLIRDFTALCAGPTLLGSNLFANYPDFFSNIWTVDQAFLLLAAGLPRWLPIPRLTRAHIARRKILADLTAFHTAMAAQYHGKDPGPEWQDLDDVGTLVKARMGFYEKYGISIRARAATEHSLLWAANANTAPLVFWMLVRIYADADLLRLIREEMSPYVRVVQAESSLPVPESPRWENMDVEGLCTQCPLLKSCYVECLRVDSASWSFKIAKQDFVLRARDKDAQAWEIHKGEYVHAAHDLHNTNPNFFEHPAVWKADRHVRYEGEGAEKRGVADLGTIRPYGGGASMCKGRHFAFKETMVFVAAIISTWEMQPAGGKAWKIPDHTRATSVFGAKQDVRVWLRRRALPQEV